MAKVSEVELVALFYSEVALYVPRMQEGLDLLSEGRGDDRTIAELHRLFHNIKSASAHVQFLQLSDAARQVEFCLAGCMARGELLPEELIQGLQKITGLLAEFEVEQMTPELETHIADTVHNLFDDSAEQSLGGIAAGQGDKISQGSLNYIDEAFSLLPLLREMVTLLDGDCGREAAKLITDRFSSGFSVLLGVLDLVGHGERYRHLQQVPSMLARSIDDGAGQEGWQQMVPLLEDAITMLELAFERLAEESVKISGLETNPASESGSENIGPIGTSAFEEDIFGTSELDNEPDDLLAAYDTPEEMQDFEAELLGDEKHSTADDGLESGDLFAEDGIAADDLFAGDDLSEQEPQSAAEELDEERLLLLEIFRTECDEHLITCNDEINSLESIVQEPMTVTGSVREHLSVLRRSVHTLKGAAAMTGVTLVARGSHCLEDALDWLHDTAVMITPVEVGMLASGIDILERLAEQPDGESAPELLTLEEEIALFLAESGRGETGSPQTEEEDLSEEGAVEDVALSAQPNYVEGEALEPIAGDDIDSHLPGDTGTLRVRLNDLDELSSIEGEMVVARGAMEKMVEEFSQNLGELNNVKENLKRRAQELEVGFEVQSLYGFNPGGRNEGEDARNGDLDEFDPIELDRYSQLNLIIRSLNEISVDVNAIHSTLASLMASFGGQVRQQQLTMRMMQEKLLRIRMTPLSSISRVLFRTVRETSRNLGKNVALTISGEDVYMDRFVWAKMTDPLMHVLRNCVDHGIEESSLRELRSKPEKGTIRIEAEQHSRNVILRVTDDGGGVDLAAVRAKVAQEGLAPDPDSLSDDALLEFLFHSSFSTKTDVSTISGRGVGLDVVRKNIQELRGTVKLVNNGEKGVSFVFQIPFTLSVNRAVLVTAAGKTWAIPLQDVQQIKKVSRLHVEIDNGMFLHLEDRRLELVNLGAYLQLEPKRESFPEDSGDLLLILFGQDDELSAVYVDAVVEQREIVVKNLGTHLTHVEGVAGVTFTGTGSLIPILNLTELAAVEATRPESTEVEEDNIVFVDKAQKVLIVDDSISVRHNVARLVESLSWQQQQAVDGVDALEKLETYRPDVIVLDIEMPRMNGYEFKSHLNNLDMFKDIPVIMLTSRASDKHRQKALELGVQHYMTKPYNPDDFSRLLEEISSKRRAAGAGSVGN